MLRGIVPTLCEVAPGASGYRALSYAGPVMRRLGSLSPRLGKAPGRLASTSTAGSGFIRADGRSSTARGYGQDWRRLRASILRAEPLCRICHAEGRVTAATDLDHVEPFHGIDDPKRLDPANLRPLCRFHHLHRTAKQSHGQE